MVRELVFPVILQVVGAAVIIAEFVLPSGGILTIAALGCFGYSLYHVFQNISPKAGFFFVAGDVILIPAMIIVGIKLLANSPVTLRTALSREKGVASQDINLEQLVNKTGIVETALRPSGKARIEGRRFDVVSEGDYINAADKIIVTEVNGNRIVVRKIES